MNDNFDNQIIWTDQKNQPYLQLFLDLYTKSP